MKRFVISLVALLGTIFSLSAASRSLDENAILCPENSLEMFHWDLEFIRHANKSIDIAACLMGGDIAQELLNALDKRLSEVSDLQIYLLVAPAVMEDRNHHQIKELLSKYPKQFHFESTPDIPVLYPNYSSIFCHVKCVVVDERYFSMGGTNLNSVLCADGTVTPPRGDREGINSFLPAAGRDQDILGRGPFAKELRLLFHKIFAQWEDYMSGHEFALDPENYATKNHYFPVAVGDKAFVAHFEEQKKLQPISTPIKLVLSGPMNSSNLNSAQYAQTIREAKKEIVIGNIYFNPASSIMEALKEASNRGVKITLITNGVRDNSPGYNPFLFWVNRINYIPLFFGKNYHYWDYWTAKKDQPKKVKIYEYAVSDIVYHKKVMVIDNQITVIGSYNLGSRSAENDYEVTVTMDSKEIAAQCLKILEKDKSLSVEVNPDEALGWYFDPYLNYLGTLQMQYHHLY